MEWWANIVGVAATWLLADTGKAVEIGDRLNMLPEPLANCEDPLPGYICFIQSIQRLHTKDSN